MNEAAVISEAAVTSEAAVIPAKAGIQSSRVAPPSQHWIPAFAGMTFALLSACSPRHEPTPASEEASADTAKADISESESESDDTTAPVIATAADDEPVPDETAPITYETQIAFGGDVFFRVKVYGQDNRKLLVVQAMSDGKVVGEPAKTPIDGDVVNAVATDLDDDEDGEVLVFARSRTEGRPGTFAGFAFADERFSSLALPDLDRKQAKGYRGGDAFSVDAGHVIRRFPVFEGTGDQPTARTRTIRYSLQPGYEFAVDSTEG